MKLFLIWPNGGSEINVLFNGLRDAGHEVLYWVGEKESAQHAPRKTIFHDHYEAWDAKPSQQFSGDFEPPSSDLIEKMYKTESLIMTMMNKRYDKSSVDERKHIYYSMLGYWDGVIKALKPEAIVFPIIPHTVYNFIIHDLAKLYGIPTLMFEEAPVGGRLMFYRDFWHGNDELRSELAKLRGTSVSPDDLCQELREYWERETRPDAEAPWYMKEQKKNAAGRGLWSIRFRAGLKALKQGTLFNLAWQFVRKGITKDLKDEYLPLTKDPSFDTPYVYLPLSFQPERTSSPQGSMYHDQILLAETLAAALPQGWEVFVKEHPSQWWLRTKTRYSSARYPGYYERLARIPRVRLVPITTNSRVLTERAQAVAVVTGTAGWEGLIRGKTTLVFGYPWYRDCPGATFVHSVTDCRHALVSIASGKNVPTQSDILAFLKAFEKTSVKAHIGQPTDSEWNVTPEEGMKKLTGVILDELKNIAILQAN